MCASDPPAASSPALPVVFFGTAELAAASLRVLAASPLVRVGAVVTQPDKPQGRDLHLAPSPVKRLALELGLPVLQPVKARAAEFVDELRELAPDLIIVAAYGQILPSSILELPRHGCLNVHASLLPKYRGAAPIQWAIANGDPITGVTIMKMDAGLDTGAMLTAIETPITDADTGATVHDRLAHLGAELLIQTLPGYTAGRIVPRAQPDGATYARKITKEDGAIDWTLPATDLWNRQRAFTPWPGAFAFEPGRNARLKVHEAEVVPATNGVPGEIISAQRQDLIVKCGIDALRLLTVQREGARRMTAQEYLAGNRVRLGDRFTTAASPDTNPTS